MKRHFHMDQNTITYEGNLIVDAKGGMRLTRAEGQLNPGERSVAVTLKVPRAVFRTPTLRAVITMPETSMPAELTAEGKAELEEKIRSATDLKIELSFAAGSVT
jgi:hypothetical protein